MKTKEEILTEHGCPPVPFDENVTMFYPAILEAMEAYKNQFLLPDTCPVCGSTDLIEAPHMGSNCNNCHPLKNE